jgi:type III restriction enzyme
MRGAGIYFKSVQEDLSVIRLRDYQERAVKELLSKSQRLISLSGNKILVFKAPTGSGKTIMMAEYLKRLDESGANGKPLAFIWTAPRKLHTQSKEKLEAYYQESRALKPIEFEELSDRQIGEGEILFFNWESINREDNVYIRDNEQEFNLTSVVDRTQEAGREIVLIIDEAHHSANTENSQGLIDMMNPKLTINVSATPTLQGDGMVNVFREEVIDEGMIKKQVLINPGFKNLIVRRRGNNYKFTSDANESTDEQVLRIAIEKREELQKVCDENGIQVNPLLLVQLPDRRRDTEFDYQEEIERMLRENHNITIDNGKLAIYLSENKENLENLTRNDNEAEVMIFKQAIALGWDCPRASILCLFREWQSFTFSTQTLGRIMRMPELKHYENDTLNTAFVYTTTSDLSILEDVAGDYVTIQYSGRKDIYELIGLHSVHRKRQRERTRLSPKFNQCLMEAVKEQDLKSALDLDKREVLKKLVTDGEIESIDQDIKHLSEGRERDGYHGDVIEVEMNVEDLQRKFDQFVKTSLDECFYPEPRSVGRVKDAIYTFFSFYFAGKFKKYDSEIQKIVLNKDNQQKMINALNRAQEIYISQVEQEEKKLEITNDWEIPESHNYNINYARKEYRKAIMDPSYEREDASQVEKEFAEYLDGNKEVKWWFKNGEKLEKFFAVPYEYNGEEKPFYVDWLVMLEDGRLGLFDTKGGITAESPETKAKAEGLWKYMQEENGKGKNIIGGIVVEKDESWRVNDNEEYSYNENDLSEWKFFENI